MCFWIKKSYIFKNSLRVHIGKFLGGLPQPDVQTRHGAAVGVAVLPARADADQNRRRHCRQPASPHNGNCATAAQQGEYAWRSLRRNQTHQGSLQVASLAQRLAST
jgi:hypothetical protein